MLSPYTNKMFKTYVYIRPDQINNEIRANIKNNLINNLEKKCFKNYGFIVKIKNIESYSEGRVMSDNSYSPIRFEVYFNCKLCFITQHDVIICKVDKVTEELIKLENGPIIIFVPSDRIDKNRFFIDTNNNIWLRQQNNTKLLTNSDYVKVTILSTIFEDKNENITALGFINDIAQAEEIKEFYENMHQK